MTPYALILVLLSALLHASWNTAAKGSPNPTAFLFATDLLGAAVLLPVLLVCDLGEVPVTVWGLLAVTAVAHSLYFYWLSRGYERGDLNLVYPIARSTPAFVPLVAVPLYGERISLLGGVGIALVVLGIWLVQARGRVRLSGLLAPGAGYAYLTLASTVVYSLVDKRAMAELEAAPWSGAAPRAVVYYLLLTLAHTPLFLLLARRRVAPSVLAATLRGEGKRLLGATLATFASYTLILEAYREAPVSYVVALRQSSVVFAALLGVLWLRERPGVARLAGVLGTVAGVALIAIS